jgi:hypothetical protein
VSRRGRPRRDYGEVFEQCAAILAVAPTPSVMQIQLRVGARRDVVRRMVGVLRRRAPQDAPNCPRDVASPLSGPGAVPKLPRRATFNEAPDVHADDLREVAS